jgi:PTS system nitrogen regulatory IIA component
MTHTLAGLRSLFGVNKDRSQVRTRRTQSRNVMMHMTVDAQHATPVCQALIRDCAGQSWTIRVAPLHKTGRVRVSLSLPRDAVNGAIQHVVDVAPTAEFGQLLEVPDTPTHAWQSLMHPASSARTSVAGGADEAPVGNETIAALLDADHVLLGVDTASRDELFSRVGRFVEQHHGFPAADVAAGLTAREVLGSTGLGQGVAVPHGQIKGLRHAIALYVRPALPVPFDAPDGAPVSDVVVLLVPEWANSTHLHLLADVAQCFCDHRFREQLRACIDAPAVCKLFMRFNADGANRSSMQRTPLQA